MKMRGPITRLRRLCTILRPSSSNASRQGLGSDSHKSSSTSRPAVILILGAGAGIGQSTARKFAEKGFHAALVRRGPSGGPNRLLEEGEGDLSSFLDSIRSVGGSGSVHYCDATDEREISRVVRTIERDIGDIQTAVYNVGAQMGNRTLDRTSYRIFKLALSMGAFGAFAMAKEIAPFMERRGNGTMIFTSATAAFRGNRMQHAHAAAMGARRNLAQCLNHELGPKGIHVCHVNLDGMVDSPETIGKMFPEMYKHLKDDMIPNDAVILPEHVANTYWFLHNQPKHAWTFEMDIRPWNETPWFNS